MIAPLVLTEQHMTYPGFGVGKPILAMFEVEFLVLFSTFTFRRVLRSLRLTGFVGADQV